MPLPHCSFIVVLQLESVSAPTLSFFKIILAILSPIYLGILPLYPSPLLNLFNFNNLSKDSFGISIYTNMSSIIITLTFFSFLLGHSGQILISLSHFLVSLLLL